MAWAEDEVDEESSPSIDASNEIESANDASSSAQAEAAESFLDKWRESRQESPRDESICGATDDPIDTSDPFTSTESPLADADSSFEPANEAGHPHEREEDQPISEDHCEPAETFETPDSFADATALADFGRGGLDGHDDSLAYDTPSFGGSPHLESEFNDAPCPESDFQCESNSDSGFGVEEVVDNSTETSEAAELSDSYHADETVTQLSDEATSSVGGDDAEEPDFSSLSSGATVSTADILAKFGHSMDSDEPATPVFEPEATEVAVKEADPWRSVIEEDSDPVEEDDSLTNYIDCLMQRVRADGSSEPPQPSLRAEVKAVDETPDQPVSKEPDQTDSDALLRPDEFVPRHRTPEHGLDLTGMRELAYHQANKAIVTHEKWSWAESAQAKRVAAITMFVVGTLLIFFAGFTSLIGYVGVFASYTVAVYWLKQAHRFARTSKRIVVPTDEGNVASALFGGKRFTPASASEASSTEPLPSSDKGSAENGQNLDDFERELLGK